ncbi:Uma2 family endonuclease [Desulfococcaceae bacterium HSG8]|nr:Uma2 family endonuclease [Desulfococcaceae bacterium HSG8]
MQQAAISLISEAEYLEQERLSETKHEYYQGEMFAMAGASRRHNLIVANIIGELRYQLKGKPCRTYPSDMRLKIETSGLYTYPDVMVVCGEEKFSDEKENALLNPDVIVEVLSDSTEGYDRGTKFRNYRQIESLKEYVLVSQNDRKIEKYSRTDDNRWILTETHEAEPEIILESICCNLNISEVYDKTEDSPGIVASDAWNVIK